MKPKLSIEQCTAHRDDWKLGISPARSHYQPHEVVDWLIRRCMYLESVCDQYKRDRDAAAILAGSMIPMTFERLVEKHCKKGAA